MFDAEDFHEYFLDDEGAERPGISIPESADVLTDWSGYSVTPFQVRRAVNDLGGFFKIGNTVVVTLDDMPELATELGIDAEDDTATESDDGDQTEEDDQDDED